MRAIVTLGLRIHGSRSGASFDRTFDRPPVLLGREVDASQCRLDDPLASKLHASIDFSGGFLRVRDASSTNGTYVGGKRVEPDRWVVLGSTQGEIRIGGWAIRVATCELAAPEVDARTATLSTFVDSLSGRPSKPGPPQAAAERPFLELQAPEGGTFDLSAPVAQLMPLYASLIQQTKELYASAVRQLEATPPTSRANVCRQMATAFPTLESDANFAALFRHYGWAGSRPSAAPSATVDPRASAALGALENLAGWYLGRDRRLASPAEITTFAEKVRATLDEFLVGFVPLVAGLNRFEQQMALRDERAGGLPRSPTELAVALLDNRDPSGAPLRNLRASFADLMMHQVALLHGVMRGVKALLTELSPAVIQGAAKQQVAKRGWLARWFTRGDPWAVYEARHSDLTDEENERFHLMFGREFADEYRHFGREMRE